MDAEVSVSAKLCRSSFTASPKIDAEKVPLFWLTVTAQRTICIIIVGRMCVPGICHKRRMHEWLPHCMTINHYLGH